MPAGVLLIPLSTVAVAGAGRCLGCGQMNEDRDCVVLAGIALGEVVVVSVGMGVALERSARIWLSTIARASSIIGLTGASCSRSLAWSLAWTAWSLAWSDILVSSEGGGKGGERIQRKRESRGIPGGVGKESEESRARCSKYVGCFIRKKGEGRR
jgi:hypothetical protein